MESVRRRGKKSERGQAVVEYVLMLLFVVGAVSLIAVSFREALLGRRGLWQKLGNEIAAPCIGCRSSGGAVQVGN